ncbi:DUF6653 family protein [Tropicimonas sp. IMCC34043]|uniref:DUF6653 family protein n=1 Tax=Tropicimonas sp. IMCC34043 TaxID=2248760 RepID=UPI000E268B3E|nr:DUF6653 family protein [Tropicimonas sp. IMCC34043]
MNGWRLSERLMAMDDATWQRHSNPLSGWSRLTILPLLSAAVWSRVWIEWWSLAAIALVLIWTWLNPRLFKPPASKTAWMTKGVLGERILLAHRDQPIREEHRRIASLLSLASATGCLLIAVALWALLPGLLLAGWILAMGAKLWFLDRMVWLYEESTTARA